MKLEDNITNKNGSYNEVTKPILDLAYKHLDNYIHELGTLTTDLSLGEIRTLTEFAVHSKFISLLVENITFDED